MTTHTDDHLKHGRRLTSAHRALCRREGLKQVQGLPHYPAGDLAQRLRCHRDTTRYWMQKSTGAQLPGPVAGTRRRPLAPVVAQQALIYRTEGTGAEVPVVAQALRADFPDQGITDYQVRALKRDRHWTALRVKVPRPPTQPFEATRPGFLHIDTIIGSVYGAPVVFTARERSSRFSWAEVSREKTSAQPTAFLQRLVERSPIAIHTILSDNGSEFAKTFAAYARAHGLQHRHTKPRRPQTNGMVERFNGTLKAAMRAHCPTWWSDPSDGLCSGDLIALERDGTPVPDRQVVRMQREVDRWLAWLNLVRPNRQLAWQTPMGWLQALERDQPASLQRPATTMFSDDALQRMTWGLAGRRYLTCPPPNWSPAAGLSMDP